MLGIFSDYMGGKSGTGMYQQVINRMIMHDVLIVGCVGNGGILRNIRPAKHTICLDKNPEIIRLWNQHPIHEQRSIEFNQCDVLEYLLELVTLGESERRVLIYLDPPYLEETRRSSNKYAYEMTREQHEDLLTIARTLGERGYYLLISCYPNTLYAEALSGWDSHCFEAVTRGTGNNKQTRTEQIYYNYNASNVVLHDYRYWGGDFRERELNTKMVRKMIAKFQRLPLQRRRALYQQLLPLVENELVEQHLSQ